MITVLKNIRSLRSLRGWSQEVMAEKLGISVHGYSNIERGETDVQLSRLQEIAQVLEVDVADLFTFDKGVFLKLSLHNNNNTASSRPCQLVNSSCITPRSEHTFELVIEQKDREIALLRQQNQDLREMLAFLKK
jgi:transcriptional regulator with XRE-family HTH domain